MATKVSFVFISLHREQSHKLFNLIFGLVEALTVSQAETNGRANDFIF